MLTIRKAAERGHANHGWLDTYHSFSFASWQNPARVHFGMLRVLNDDKVAPTMGFGMHPHENMEIVTIPLTGELKHADSMGNSGVIRSGEVQIMSAGTGIRHSEMNASHHDPVTLLQIWVFPKERNIKPRYDQRPFDVSEYNAHFRPVVSPVKEDDALWINQDAWFSLGHFNEGEKADYTIRLKDNGAYVFLIEGEAEIDGTKLSRRDAIGVWDTDKFSLNVTKEAQILVIDVPMN